MPLQITIPLALSTRHTFYYQYSIALLSRSRTFKHTQHIETMHSAKFIHVESIQLLRIEIVTYFHNYCALWNHVVRMEQTM